MSTPHTTGHCDNCERCTWNPGPDCGRLEHPHCERCGHCIGRHVSRDRYAKPILIPCEGSKQPTNYFQGFRTCQMCGAVVATDEDAWAVEHHRDDILARINRGDFG